MEQRVLKDRGITVVSARVDGRDRTVLVRTACRIVLLVCFTWKKNTWGQLLKDSLDGV